MNRIVCTNAADWLAKRQEIGIGASQAACILGLNPYKSNTELWQELTGRKQADDFTAKCGERGKASDKNGIY